VSPSALWFSLTIAVLASAAIVISVAQSVRV
jgi:hypothetical protein